MAFKCEIRVGDTEALRQERLERNSWNCHKKTTGELLAAMKTGKARNGAQMSTVSANSLERLKPSLASRQSVF